MVKKSDETVNESEVKEEEIPTFTPDDLVAAIMLIDEGANNGAFKGWEMIQRSMHTRIRLHAFAQHWQKTIEEASAEALNNAAKGGE